MHLALLILAALTSLVLAAAFVDLFLGHRQLRALKDVAPSPDGPSVSIVVAARNEARGIEAALQSLLRLRYQRLEIIVVNDRSTDGTGAILARLAGEHRMLRIRSLSELPDGWLGKNYAMFAGATEASGEFLLFTDADVVFEATAVARAMTIVAADRLDHLAALPAVEARGVALKTFIAAFGVLFSLYSRPWKAPDPRSPRHIGIGAFNLIRASVYQAIGTHRAIALRPDDDMKLGKLVKKHGYRQEAADGRGFVIVEWYSSLREAIDGLMKNAFAGVNYSVLAVIGSTAALFLLGVWPSVAVFVTSGAARALNIVSVLLIVLTFCIATRRSGVPAWLAVAFPIATLLFVYVIWRSALIAITSGSITWRGTAYPLARMRANRV